MITGPRVMGLRQGSKSNRGCGAVPILHHQPGSKKRGELGGVGQLPLRTCGDDLRAFPQALSPNGKFHLEVLLPHHHPQDKLSTHVSL
jgi:hypothetical protein